MLWHTSAFVHFSLRPQYMMRKLSKRSDSSSKNISATPEGDKWHHDIMFYLGNINVGYAVLAGVRLWHHIIAPTPTAITETDMLALAVLGIANASQAWGNFMLSPSSGRWIMGTGLDRITVLDALFTVLDGAIVLAHFWGHWSSSVSDAKYTKHVRRDVQATGEWNSSCSAASLDQ